MSTMPVSFGPDPWLQQHWDWRAACNFILGGSGAGLVVAASLLDGGTARAALLGGLGLIALGLAAVWLEIGRKLRAVHVFFNPQTSWMTRESFAALLVLGLGAASLASRAPWLPFAAALAAVVFAYCQGRILHASKGIPAWRRPEVVPLMLVTGLAEGAGLALALQPTNAGTALFAFALVARAFAWSRYHAAMQGSGAALALEVPGRVLVQLGTVAPLALLAVAAVFAESVWLAAAGALFAGWRFKFVLVARAALNQGFALPRLPVRGTH